MDDNIIDMKYKSGGDAPVPPPRTTGRKTILEALVFAGISVLFYMLFFPPLNLAFFLAVHQVYYLRRGKGAFIGLILFSVCAVAIIGALVLFFAPFAFNPTGVFNPVMQTINIKGNFEPLLGIIAIGLGFTVLGFIFVNVYSGTRVRTLYKVLGISIVTSLVGVAVLFYIIVDSQLTNDFVAFVNGTFEQINKSLERNDLYMPEDQIIFLFRLGVFSLFSSFNFIVLSFAWWLGRVVSYRYFMMEDQRFDHASFRVPDAFVWPVIASLAGLAVSMVSSLSVVGIISINVLVIFLVLFEMRGFGIIQFYAMRNVFFIRFSRFLPFVFVVLFLFVPPAFPLVFLATATLGIADIWVGFRERTLARDDFDDE